jgi:hypothetical protein
MFNLMFQMAVLALGYQPLADEATGVPTGDFVKGGVSIDNRHGTVTVYARTNRGTRKTVTRDEKDFPQNEELIRAVIGKMIRSATYSTL